MPYQEPEYLPWDGRSVPMTLLGGYLGAGKTTVLNRLLATADRPIAVLVNDAGEVNIDAALIRRRNRDTIELTDGCVCCSLSGGMGEAIDKLRERETPPEHVVVELSGVADPVRVAPWGFSAGFRLDGIVVLADAETFAEHSANPMIGPALERQIVGADLLVVTKVDLVDAATVGDVRSRLEALAPGVPVVSNADADTLATLVSIGGGRRFDPPAVTEPTLFDRHHTSIVPLPDPIERSALDALLDGLDPAVVRAKAVANVIGEGAGEAVPSSVQVVGRRRKVEPLADADRQPATNLVVISVDG